MRLAFALLPAALLVPTLSPAAPPPAPGRVLPPLSQQLALRERWIDIRHGMLLGMMRRHGVAMWIVATQEFHEDPLAPLVATPRPLAGGRDLFVFVDAGEKGLRKVAITGFAEENVSRVFESPADPRAAKDALPELYRAHDPKTIALSIGGKRGLTRSLTYDGYRFLVEALGPEAEKRFVPAEPLIEEYLDTRIPEERPYYEALMELTERLARRALSAEAITPGRTTVGDVRAWLFDRLGEEGVGTWFQPDLRVQRRGQAGKTSRGFLAVSPEATVIQPGDLLHLDFGVSAMGLATDWQKMAYVLRPGETDAPAGLRAVLAGTHALQDALCRSARPGRTAGDVYKDTMAEMEKRGITAQIYSHPVGNHGHGAGPSIDFRAAKRDDMSPAKPLRPGSYLSVELNTRAPVPEWDGQEVFVMQEDPAELTDVGYRMFRSRQDAFYLVR